MVSGYQKRLAEIRALKEEVERLKAKLITNPKVMIDYNVMTNKFHVGIMFAGNMYPPSFLRMEGQGDTVKDALLSLKLA